MKCRKPLDNNSTWKKASKISDGMTRELQNKFNRNNIRNIEDPDS